MDTPPSRSTRLRKHPFRFGLSALLMLYLVTAAWNVWKPLPGGTNRAGPLQPASGVAWLADTTWVDTDGTRHTEQVIFDEVFRLIGQAEKLVVIDMFLYNDFQGPAVERHRPLSGQLTAALITRKHEHPALRALVITDPINTLYGGLESPQFAALRAAGIEVIVTDLDRLRDSNPGWSALWRLCCRWFGNDPDGGWLPSPMSRDEITLRSYLELPNFKANHRKTLVVDEGETWTGLVTSANPHDASSAHGNSAIRFSGEAALDLLDSELAVARMSGHHDLPDLPSLAPPGNPESNIRIQILTEAAIRDALIDETRAARPDDRLRIGMFYFSHRELIEAVLAAHRRGVDIRIILDPNKDAFGREKSGVPNRQVAAELHAAGIPLRWCDTHGEQCHTKMLLRVGTDDKAALIQGSANFTRRNLDNFNLETNVRVIGPDRTAVIHEAETTFDNRWANRGGRLYTSDYDAYADAGLVRYLQYRFMEASGWSTF